MCVCVCARVHAYIYLHYKNIPKEQCEYLLLRDECRT